MGGWPAISIFSMVEKGSKMKAGEIERAPGTRARLPCTLTHIISLLALQVRLVGVRNARVRALK